MSEGTSILTNMGSFGKFGTKKKKPVPKIKNRVVALLVRARLFR